MPAARERRRLGEDAAVATQLLLATRARARQGAQALDPADKPTDKPAMGGGVPTADSATKQAASPLSAAHRQALLAHFSALEHYLGLWERGLELPGF